MALRAGLVASQRLWFTSVNGYGSCEREKNVEINEAVKTRLSMTNWRHATLQTHFVVDMSLCS